MLSLQYADIQTSEKTWNIRDELLQVMDYRFLLYV
jgi:hypothetical protein